MHLTRFTEYFFPRLRILSSRETQNSPPKTPRPFPGFFFTFVKHNVMYLYFFYRRRSIREGNGSASVGE